MIKHGWDSTSKICYEKLAALANDPDQDVVFPRFDIAGEQTAELGSWQPIVFYLLVLGSIASFIIHRHFAERAIDSTSA
jgi:hypothetical protein